MKILIKLLTVLMSVLLIIGIQFPILASNEELEDLLIELNAVPGEVIELPEMKELIIITAEHMPAVETGEEKPNKQIVKLNFQFNEILLNANSVMTVSKQGEKAALLQKSVTGDISITDLFIDFPYTVSFYTELDGRGISYSGTLRILEKGKDEKHLEILDNLYAYAYLLHDDLPVTRSVSSPEYEPNDTMSDANHMEGDDTRFGKISVREDVDYYKVQLGYDGKANFWLGDIPTGKDYDLYLYNSAGEQIARSATSGNAEPIFDFDVVQEETYYMKVVGYNGSNDSENYYQIRAKMISYTHEDDYGNTYYDAITIEEGQEITAQIDYVGNVDFFLIVFGTPPDINDSNYYSLYTTGSLDTY